MKTRTALPLAGCLLLAACATHPSNPQDPLEPMNRAIYQFNDKADRYVMKPAAEGYRFITPQPVRTGVSNFFHNLEDVYSMVNHGAQLEGKKTLNDMMRVTFNSTFGLFGLIDIATPMGLKRDPATLGDTMAHYGWKNSSYLVLPLFGPSTIRDGLSTAANMTIADPHRLVFHSQSERNVANVVKGVSNREQILGLDDTLQQAALDPYSYMRDAWLQYRNTQVGYQPAGAQQGDTPATPGATPADSDNIDDLVSPDASAPAASAPAAAAPAAASAAQ
ncbi:VacJ family lipoprotein [Vogesella sp. LIG4]|uniref:MlaA family lipoprotein n=1 Tax=Vogesella sp. LIG4 TaxID=1192162 RepID=UPI00081FA312|nr:VacJ family lipoprotein [Vogesella sp. LIG4]SCK17118.1 phospholipid-binding lipoprotein MlaA [Vogesella sp. LIG4]